jgi:hypothetical protein
MWNSQYYLKCIYNITYRSTSDMFDAHIRRKELSPKLWVRQNSENTIGNCYQYAAIYAIEHICCKCCLITMMILKLM